jgi:tryptophan-rich sensory protein
MTAARPVAWKPAIVAALAAFLVAGTGGVLSKIGPWYFALNKPWWQPPDWAFGPAWTLIFGLIAASGAVAWHSSRSASARRAIIAAFALNAMLNMGWSLLFFHLQHPDWAVIEVVFLWLSIVLLILVVRPSSRRAAWLLAPYLCWVTFASYLNLTIVRLN